MTSKEDDWCDNCRSYTHMPWCPAYVPPSHERPASAAGSERRLSTRCDNAQHERCLYAGECECDCHEPAPPAPETGEGSKRYLLSEVEHLLKENHSLIAERERLAETLREARQFITKHVCVSSGSEELRKTQTEWFQKMVQLIDAALTLIDQKGSGSE